MWRMPGRGGSASGCSYALTSVARLRTFHHMNVS